MAAGVGELRGVVMAGGRDVVMAEGWEGWMSAPCI